MSVAVDLIATPTGARITVVAAGVRVEADVCRAQVEELARDCLAILDADESHSEHEPEDDEGVSRSAEDTGGECIAETAPSPPTPATLAAAPTPRRALPNEDDPQPLGFSRSVLRFMRRAGISPEDVIAGFFEGGQEWISPRQSGDSLAYVRAIGQEWAAAYYPDGDGGKPFVVSILPLARAYDERRLAGSRQAGRAKPGSAARARPKPTDQTSLLRLLRDRGFGAEHTGTDHLRVTHPDRPHVRPVTISSTPSDHRSVTNSMAQLRRSFPGLLD